VIVVLAGAGSIGLTIRAPDTTRYFPMAVWYGGGTARAPILERDAR
jgi:hypothetical protein